MCCCASARSKRRMALTGEVRPLRPEGRRILGQDADLSQKHLHQNQIQPNSRKTFFHPLRFTFARHCLAQNWICRGTLNAAETTPSVGSHGRAKNDQMVTTIRPMLLNQVRGMDSRTSVFERTDGTVASTRPTPALSRLVCITPVAIAAKRTA